LLAAQPGSARAQDRVLAVTTDYTTGSLATLAVSSPWGANCDLAPVCADAVVRAAGGLIYVVNRFGCDNIQVINPATWTIVREFSVGSETNPQDIAVISPTRAYVSRYETNDLLEVNPSTGAILGTISLAAFADQDGLCEMHRMILHGDRLFVQLQRMVRRDWPDPWIPARPSLLVVIDVNTRQIVDADPSQPGIQGIALAGANPVAPIQVDHNTGEFLVAGAGQYNVLDAAGIERVDPVEMRSLGLQINEQTLGGDLVDFAQWSPSRAYAIVTLPGFNTVLVSYNPATGQRISVVYNPGSFVLADVLSYPTGLIFVSDRDFINPGVRVYNAADGTPAGGPIFTCLPPNELIVLPASSSGVEFPDLVEVLGQGSLGPPRPNPSAGAVTLSLNLGAPSAPAGAAVGVDREDVVPRWMAASGSAPVDPTGLYRLEVYDIHGRRVRTLAADGAKAPSDITWDGADSRGSMAHAGVYFLRLTQGGRPLGSRTVRIVH